MTYKPLISVLMNTYNHENYIQKAIEGVLMQECDFSVELIIVDDKSSDNTNMIVSEIVKTHPKKRWIKYTSHAKNKGMADNFIWTLNRAKGDYIALCEGDDYWTDYLKLQRQVDFLEKNKQYGAVANNALVLNDNGETYLFGRKKSRIVIAKEFIRSRQFATASVVFKNNITIPDEFNDLIACDTSLMLLINKKDPIFYINEVTSVYRHGQQGVTAKFKDENYKIKLIELELYLNKITNEKYYYTIKNNIREIDAMYFKENKIIVFLKNRINYLDSLLYSLICIKILRIKSQDSFDIKKYPFYRKIYYRIFG